MSGLVAVAVGVSLVLVGPASPASASLPLERCYAGAPTQYRDNPPWFVPGNDPAAPWAAPAGLLHNDILHVTATGTVRIDYWGTTKSIAGELPVAPAGWPLPGARRYMLIAKVTQGAMWSASTGRIYESHEWFPVGADSGCLMFLNNGWTSQRLVFSFNDPNLGDNGGGASVTVRQWWGVL